MGTTLGNRSEVPVVWLDTNVLFRYLLNDHDVHSHTAKLLIEKAARGEVRLRLAMIIVMECCETLKYAFGLDKSLIADAMLKFLQLTGIETEERRVMEETLKRYGRIKNVDFADAYLATYAMAKKPAHVVTFNVKDFQLAGLTVSQPSEL